MSERLNRMVYVVKKSISSIVYILESGEVFVSPDCFSLLSNVFRVSCGIGEGLFRLSSGSYGKALIRLLNLHVQSMALYNCRSLITKRY